MPTDSIPPPKYDPASHTRPRGRPGSVVRKVAVFPRRQGDSSVSGHGLRFGAPRARFTLVPRGSPSAPHVPCIAPQECARNVHSQSGRDPSCPGDTETNNNDSNP